MQNLQRNKSKSSNQPEHRPLNPTHGPTTVRISGTGYVRLEERQLPPGGGQDERVHLRGDTTQKRKMQNSD